MVSVIKRMRRIISRKTEMIKITTGMWVGGKREIKKQNERRAREQERDDRRSSRGKKRLCKDQGLR